jgi:hypothetical protein
MRHEPDTYLSLSDGRGAASVGSLTDSPSDDESYLRRLRNSSAVVSGASWILIRPNFALTCGRAASGRQPSGGRAVPA